jgi:tetratricopeptide (TPR) repeat protein
LAAQGKLTEAVSEYRRAIQLRPDYADAHCNLGGALAAQGKLTEAVSEFRRAIQLRPDYADAHSNLGGALAAQGKLTEAVSDFRRAIQLQPNYAHAHYNLGTALARQRQLPEAVEEYCRTIQLQPDYAKAHCNLGLALKQQGHFQQALASLRRGHELGSKDPRWRYPSTGWVRDCERLVELDGRLVAVLEGKARPASAAERIELARFCPVKRLHRAAARFYEQAFAAEPALASGPAGVHRYNAACAAAQSGCGQGEDALSPEDPERGRLRSQALDWLRRDLIELSKELKANTPAARHKVSQILEHWQRDPDLAGVREPHQLAKLPTAEQKAWRGLWAEVAQVFRRAGQSR